MTIFTVATEDILGENYKLTKIECSDYNPNIDNSITVTITVTDVFGDALSNESVTVTASEGNFTQLNGSSITAAATVTATTNISGQFTLTYACSEWGLITFSANNKTVQCNVTGFKKIAENTTYELWVNTTTRCARIICHRTNITIGSGENFNNYGDFTIPSAYRPKKSMYRLIMRTAQFIFYLYDNGSYGIYNTGSSVSGYNLGFQIDYTF